MALSYDLTRRGSDRTQAKTLGVVDDWEFRQNTPVLISLLLSEELNTLVYFDVLLATDVRGLELVIRHCV